MSGESTNTAAPQPPSTSANLTRLFAWAVVLVLFLWFFNAVQWILLGVLAAACLAAAVRPLMQYVRGPQWLRGLLVGLVPILLSAVGVVAMTWLLATPVRRELRQWPQIRQQINELLAGWSGRLGLTDPLTVERVVQQLREFLADQPVISTTTNLVTALLLALAFVFFGAIFILIERERRFLQPLLRLMPPRRGEQLIGAIQDLEPRLRWWVLGTLISMTVVAILSWMGFAIVGLKLAIPLAILAGFAEIVPTVGPAFAFSVAVLFAVTQSTPMALGVAAIYLIIQSIESYVLVPLVMRQAVKIPPVVTLFTVVLWGKIFGIAGLLLAIPIDLLIWTIADRFLRRE